MLKFFNKRLHNRKGFTLIELIVVIAILAILALIAIPRLTGFQQDAKISADKATFETITKSISIAVVNDDVTEDVVLSTDENGVITLTSGDDITATLIENATAFKLDGNKELAGVTWVVDATTGVVSAPAIGDDGVVVVAP